MLALLEREQLLPAGCRAVVGVSGGPDSLCLLHLLWTHRDTLDVRLHVAHLNHRLRGAEADADAQFVARQAAQWGLPCTVEARDVRAFARRHGLAIEEAARQQRYAFLARVARARHATRIAVAHNADDQSETVLMHWLRGSGLAGLRGMLPSTQFSKLHIAPFEHTDKELWLVRPLLDTPRVEIERYCREHCLSPRFDRSNLDTTLYRNKLRHELLPYLEREYKPGLAQILRRSARVVRDDYDLLCIVLDRAWDEIARSTSAQAVVLNLEGWRALHPALQRATLRRAALRLRHNLRDVNYVHIQNAVQVAHGSTGDKATLPGGLQLVVGYDALTVSAQAYTAQPSFPALPQVHDDMPERYALETPGTTTLDRLSVQIQVIPRATLDDDWRQNDDPWRVYLDAEQLGPELYLRRRRAGDRMCPLGMGGRSKLVSDVLVNKKVPADLRDRVPLLVRADDRIVWLCGQHVDERARIRPSTSQVAVVRLVAKE
jgi:tRNA(Ile)-lysidine synthase